MRVKPGRCAECFAGRQIEKTRISSTGLPLYELNGPPCRGQSRQFHVRFSAHRDQPYSNSGSEEEPLSLFLLVQDGNLPTRGGLNHPAGETAASVSARLGFEIVRFFMNDDGVIEDRVRPGEAQP